MDWRFEIFIFSTLIIWIKKFKASKMWKINFDEKKMKLFI